MKNIFKASIIVMAIGVANINAYGAGLAEIACTPSGNSCSHCTKYKCKQGYYGSPTSTGIQSQALCVACPTQANGSGTATVSSVFGATKVTQCFLPDGTVGTDSTGTFVIVGPKYVTVGSVPGCPYSE